MARFFFLFGALSAGFAVAMGAWSAHNEILNEVQTVWVEKGVRYQMYHSFALLITSLLLASQKKISKPAIVAGVCFLGGILLFCGSLYAMALRPVNAGYITPAGGVLFILGWLSLACCTPGRK
ncbi:MAG: DUF423 domain-containing protein [Desulfopila sp.]|jgi:uncharacterized membrane protein YgdD (TMEM256/DUF423 family)|nr:DUF423 domain-containing protein [Desulfopila sp.]